MLERHKILDLMGQLDPAERVGEPVEEEAEPIVQFGGTPPIEPGDDGIGQDRRLGRARLCCKRLQPIAHGFGKEQLVANPLDHRHDPSSRSPGWLSPTSMA